MTALRLMTTATTCGTGNRKRLNVIAAVAYQRYGANPVQADKSPSA
jgi:hypothetical protein